MGEELLKQGLMFVLGMMADRAAKIRQEAEAEQAPRQRHSQFHQQLLRRPPTTKQRCIRVTNNLICKLERNHRHSLPIIQVSVQNLIHINSIPLHNT